MAAAGISPRRLLFSRSGYNDVSFCVSVITLGPGDNLKVYLFPRLVFYDLQNGAKVDDVFGTPGIVLVAENDCCRGKRNDEAVEAQIHEISPEKIMGRLISHIEFIVQIPSLFTMPLKLRRGKDFNCFHFVFLPHILQLVCSVLGG